MEDFGTWCLRRTDYRLGGRSCTASCTRFNSSGSNLSPDPVQGLMQCKRPRPLSRSRLSGDTIHVSTCSVPPRFHGSRRLVREMQATVQWYRVPLYGRYYSTVRSLSSDSVTSYPLVAPQELLCGVPELLYLPSLTKLKL